MDVDIKQFYEKLPEIFKSLEKAAFIAIDTEFTGLQTNEKFKGQYFDSPSARYAKQRKNLENVSICQIGISAFWGLPDDNAYETATYNFLVRPPSLLFESVVLCQVSSLEFLQDNHFSFDKWLSNSIPFLNKDQEEKIRKIFDSYLSGNAQFFLPYEILDELAEVRNWRNQGKKNVLKLHFHDTPTNALLFIAAIHTSYDDIYAYVEDREIIICGCEIEKREELSLSAANDILDGLLDYHRGFTKIFDKIVELKTPVIFHNSFLDILLMYNQFYRYLPVGYTLFKKSLHELFPMIFDTKELTYDVNYLLSTLDATTNSIPRFQSSSLYQLKKKLESNLLTMYRPSIIHNKETSKYSEGNKEFPHEAGYDAFCTGYCFINLSHIGAMTRLESTRQRPMSASEHLYALSPWANRMAIQRAKFPYIDLVKRDPVFRTASWLILENRFWRPLSPAYVSSLFSSFGSFDVVSRNKWTVLVAAARVSTAKNILRVLEGDKSIRVRRYSPFKHSLVVKAFAWSCFLVSGALVTLTAARTYKHYK